MIYIKRCIEPYFKIRRKFDALKIELELLCFRYPRFMSPRKTMQVLLCMLGVVAFVVLVIDPLKRLRDQKLRLSLLMSRHEETLPLSAAKDRPNPSPDHPSTPATVPAPSPGQPSTPATVPLKYILYWNEYYGDMTFFWGNGQKSFIDEGCEVKACFGTNNRSFMKMDKFDAILMHMQTVDSFGWPEIRSPHQRYVFVTKESAQYVTVNLKSSKYREAFNLTMTYRLDSDFPNTYGAMEPVPSPDPSGGRNYAAGKTELVAWFVSHCSSHSSRGEYVEMLQKHIPVDVYGDCGPLKCPRSANNSCHHTLLNKVYKFYLSFENSICNDYVTEKLFDVLKYDVVPVVLGGSNYSKFAPPGSYIDALKYTPKELAEYLKKLDKDDAAYNAFFEWKGKYRNIHHHSFHVSAFCDLCKYLHSNQTKVYKDMYSWWVKGQCHTNKAIGVTSEKDEEDEEDEEDEAPWGSD